MISEKKFRQFHNNFKGDSQEIFEICRDCGGLCEFNKIGTLLPKEKIFMAKQMGMSIEEFSDKYLDILLVDGEPLDVLKFVQPCPFLSKNYECACRNFKVVMCEIYPIVFKVKKNSVVFYLDSQCPIAHHDKLSAYFINVGIPSFKSLDIPLEWFKCVEKYDHLNFDYKKIQSKRASANRCEVFNLQYIIKTALKDSQLCERK
jgi:Fe-S-cluster containining protein